jgi:ATP-dependent Lon protease
VPRQVLENGLNGAQLKITDNAIELIATRYTREAGVRQLERNIGSVARKAALQIAQAQAESVNVLMNRLFVNFWGRRASIQNLRGKNCPRCCDRNGLD